MEKAQTQLL